MAMLVAGPHREMLVVAWRDALEVDRHLIHRAEAVREQPHLADVLPTVIGVRLHLALVRVLLMQHTTRAVRLPMVLVPNMVAQVRAESVAATLFRSMVAEGIAERPQRIRA